MNDDRNVGNGAICTRCGIDLDSGADCADPYRCLGSEGEIEAEMEQEERRNGRHR